MKKVAAERWVAEVNADGRFGRWEFALARPMEQVRDALDARRQPPPQSA